MQKEGLLSMHNHTIFSSKRKCSNGLIVIDALNLLSIISLAIKSLHRLKSFRCIPRFYGCEGTENRIWNGLTPICMVDLSSIRP